MNTMTKTQSVSATKLAVATAVLLAAGGLALATAPAMKQSSTAPALEGANLVKVVSCAQNENGVSVIRQFGANFTRSTLNNGCKDIGKGLKDYTFNCVVPVPPSTSSTMYMVSWKPCAPVSAPVSVTSSAPAVIPNQLILAWDTTSKNVPAGKGQLIATLTMGAVSGGGDVTVKGLSLTKKGPWPHEMIYNWQLKGPGGELLANGGYVDAIVGGSAKIVFSNFIQVIPETPDKKLYIYADVAENTPAWTVFKLYIQASEDVETTAKIQNSWPIQGPTIVFNK